MREKKRKENKNADLQFKPDDEENIKDIKGTTDEIWGQSQIFITIKLDTVVHNTISMLVTSNTLWQQAKWASFVIWIMSDNYTQQINVEKDIWNWIVACQIENLESQQRNNEASIRENLDIGNISM